MITSGMPFLCQLRRCIRACGITWPCAGAGASLRFFLDGVLQGGIQAASPSGYRGASTPLLIGSYKAYGVPYYSFNGWMKRATVE